MQHRIRHLPWTLQRAGIGLRGPHGRDLVELRPAVGFLEIHAENYMCGGPQTRLLEAARKDWPVSVHAVGLSLGSAGQIDDAHLERLSALVARIDPMLVSEHLSFTTAGGIYGNGLLPLPYDAVSLAAIAGNVQRVQERLRRRVLIENPSAYLRFRGPAMDEAEFLRELVRRTGCGLLCDVNNIHVTTTNLGGDARRWLDALPAEAVGEIHVAGHHQAADSPVPLLIDDHGAPVADPVWALYAHAVRRFPHAVTLVEWDTALPPLPVLVEEARKADWRRATALGGLCLAAAA
jgi:uncharacterized protein (UPF0276 family)